MASSNTPKTMLAWQKHIPSKEPIRVEVPIPTPKDDEVLVKLHAIGVCHSDVAVRDMESIPPEFKTVSTPTFTMGHEGCGEVVTTGSAVTKFTPGEMVAIMCVPGCGRDTCDECTRGVPQLCQKGPRYGGGQDGFFAPYVAVTERATVKLPPNIKPSVGAVATDACMTAYHAVVGRAKVQRGDTVLLLGLGGLGFNALQIILHLGARALVVDQRQVVLDEALSFGVDPKDVVPVGTPDVSEWLKDKGLRVDIAIDFVAVPATFKAAVDSVRPDGTIVVVGLLSPELSFRGPAVVRKQISILGSYAGTCSDIEACLDLIAKGKLVPQVTTGSLKDFPQLLEDLHEGKIKSRIALIPEGMEEQ